MTYNELNQVLLYCYELSVYYGAFKKASSIAAQFLRAC